MRRVLACVVLALVVVASFLFVSRCEYEDEQRTEHFIQTMPDGYRMAYYD